MSEPTPIPPNVAALKARQLPAHVREAVTERADAVRNLHTPAVGAARKQAIECIARAEKILANVPHRMGGAK